MPEVFISYRREDTLGHANSVYALLAEQLGGSEIFLDIGRMAAGSRWLDETKTQLDSCEICLAIIGQHWNPARLKDTDDIVRLELEMALNRNKAIIPVLVDGADLPVASHLPSPLKELPSMQAVWLNHRSYEGYRQDLATLAKKVRALLAQRGHYGIVEVYLSSVDNFLVPRTWRIFVSEDQVISSDNLVGELRNSFLSGDSMRVQVPVGICSVQVVRNRLFRTSEMRSDVVTFILKPHEEKFFSIRHEEFTSSADVLHEWTTPYWKESDDTQRSLVFDHTILELIS